MKKTCFALTMSTLLVLSACGGSDDNNKNPDPQPDPPKFVYPDTRKGTDSDAFFGQAVADPYRWLENIDSVEVDNWVRAQNQLSTQHFTALPDYAALSSRIAQWYGPPAGATTAKRQSLDTAKQLHIEGVQGKDGRYYYQIQQHQQRQLRLLPHNGPEMLSVDSVIYVAKDADAVSQGEALVDATQFRIDPDDHIQLKGHQVSADGKYLVYAMERNYADVSELHILDLQNPQYGPVKIANVFSGAFTLGDQGVYYATPRLTTNPHVSPHTYQTLYYKDFSVGSSPFALVQGEQFEQLIPGFIHEGFLYFNALTSMQSAVGRINLAQPENGATMLLDARAQNKSFAAMGASATSPTKLLVSTSVGALQNRLIEVDPAAPSSDNWRELLPNAAPGTTTYVNEMMSCGDDYYAEHLVQGSSRLFLYDANGSREIPLPGDGAVASMSCVENGSARPTLSYYYSSLAQPFTQYVYDPGTGNTTESYRSTYAGYDANSYEMQRLTVSSPDGTQFPLYIVHKKGLQPSADTPTLLYAYGGFAVPLTPGFHDKAIPLLESGGIYAVAQVRGGAEFGMAWHDGGRLLNKQNTYDDLAAAARHLIQRGLTSPAKLAMQGESNGGLTTAVMGLQHPDLFSVVFPTVGVLDLVRYDLFTSGFGWHGDYGQTTRQDEFENLMKISPLHNVKAQPYLPTYVFTGKSDGRVMPAHSYKYAAALQNTATGDHPYLLHAFPKDGHSLQSNQQHYLTYMWAAFFHHTGTRYTPPAN